MNPRLLDESIGRVPSAHQDPYFDSVGNSCVASLDSGRLDAPTAAREGQPIEKDQSP